MSTTLHEHNPTAPGLPLKLIFLLYLPMAAISYAIAKWALDYTVWTPWHQPWFIAVGAGVLTGITIVGLDKLTETYFSWAQNLQKRFTQILGKLTINHCFWAAALSSLGEEMLFRGLLLPAWGIIPSSLIFGLLHWGGKDKIMWLWSLLAMLMGFLFAGLTLWTGNIVAAILAHFVINFINLLRLSRKADKTSPQQADTLLNTSFLNSPQIET